MTTTQPHSGTSTTEQALRDALVVVRRMTEKFGSAYPDDTTVAGEYLLRPATEEFAAGANRGWTTSFWPGMQWIAWELTGEDYFRAAATGHLEDFARRLQEGDDLDTHDLGFLYTLSAVAPWRLLADPLAQSTALAAADLLMTRFLKPAGIVQAWGDLRDPQQRGRTIIDSLMNMPLLTWAAEQTGDTDKAEAVRRHVRALREQIVRPDLSTFHTFYWDAETGEPLRGGTAQGAFDDSCWARGQAWGIYGFALNFRVSGELDVLQTARDCADYFLAHLPADFVPYWDLVYTDGSDAPRDSSAAAIAACGLFELASTDPDTERAEHWRRAAQELLASLIDHCTPATPGSVDTVLLHGVYDLPRNVGVDEGTLWGDYFYLEALVRASRPGWRPYW